MIRKLHNSLLALSATSLALAACLIATGTDPGGATLPASSTQAATPDRVSTPDLARAAATEDAPAGFESPTGAQAVPATGYRKGKSRRNRQTLAMPFFSFATRS